MEFPSHIVLIISIVFMWLLMLGVTIYLKFRKPKIEDGSLVFTHPGFSIDSVLLGVGSIICIYIGSFLAESPFLSVILYVFSIIFLAIVAYEYTVVFRITTEAFLYKDFFTKEVRIPFGEVKGIRGVWNNYLVQISSYDNKKLYFHSFLRGEEVFMEIIKKKFPSKITEELKGSIFKTH